MLTVGMAFAEWMARVSVGCTGVFWRVVLQHQSYSR